MLLSLALNLWPHFFACPLWHDRHAWFLKMEGYLECGFASEQLSNQGLFAEGCFFFF